MLSSLIKARSICEAVIKCQRKIIKEGVFIRDNDSVVKEFLGVSVIITNPLISQDASKTLFVDTKMYDWMQNNFFNKSPIPGWNYSYGQRLFSYNGINQTKMVIRKLTKNNFTKSATITLMKPGFDDNHVPCLTTLDFKVRNTKLVLFGFFRSQDVYKKMHADILCLARIQKIVADKIGVKIGGIYLSIASAHIYEEDLVKAAGIDRRKY